MTLVNTYVFTASMTSMLLYLSSQRPSESRSLLSILVALAPLTALIAALAFSGFLRRFSARRVLIASGFLSLISQVLLVVMLRVYASHSCSSTAVEGELSSEAAQVRLSPPMRALVSTAAAQLLFVAQAGCTCSRRVRSRFLRRRHCFCSCCPHRRSVAERALRVTTQFSFPPFAFFSAA
jgi:hypothetical protein